MFSSESEEMTAWRPDDSLTFAFYGTLSNNIPNWAIFVKKSFYLIFSYESDKMTVLWQN